jgi:GntR family transcriptional regulator
MTPRQEAASLPQLPLFAQIETDLRRRIVSNQLVAGSKLPSEAELEVEFGVSRITVRQALAALHANGLIEKINGKGSFVTRPADAPKLGPLTGFFDHMRAKGHTAQGRTISVREVDAPDPVALALGLAPRAPVTAVTMLRSVDARPMAYGIAYGASDLVRALLEEDIESNDLMSLLESRMGFRLKNTHIETSALPAGRMRARVQAIDAQDPVLRIRFTPHDVTDKPLLHADMYFRGDSFSYKAVVKR